MIMKFKLTVALNLMLKRTKKLVGSYLRCAYNHVLLEKNFTALSNSNSRVASLTVTLTFHMELVNYGFDTRYADITLYVVTLRHIPWGGFPQMVFLLSEQLNPIWSGSLVSWILDSNLWLDSGFLVLDSGFQSPGFRIPQARNSWIPESGFPYMGRTRRKRKVIEPDY